jgi:hypothetical protein
MTGQEFNDQVAVFVDCCLGDYFNPPTITIVPGSDYFPDERTAEILLTTCYGTQYMLTLKISEGGDELAIQVGESGELDASREGVYCYLWHMAEDSLRERRERAPKVAGPT